MQISATGLGREYGLTGQEMNLVIAKLGYLIGEPGSYAPTEKAQEYVREYDHHRGCGGSPWYNRYWETRSYDDSIKDKLNVTPELIQEARDELSARRAAQRTARILASEQADREFLERQAQKAAEELAEKEAEIRREKGEENLRRAGEIAVFTLAIVGVSYAVYTLIPRVKKWWDARKEEKSQNEVPEESDETEHKIKKNIT